MKPTYSKKSKYRSRKVTIDGVTYDSLKEYHRFCDLKLMQRAGIITGLQRQVKYELLPTQRINGKVIERPVNYYADFVYKMDRQLVVEDVKGYKTPEYVIKRKLMLSVYGIQIHEV